MSDTKNENKKEILNEEIKLSRDTLEKIRNIDMDYDLAVSFFKILAMEESRQKSGKSTISQRYKNGEYKPLEELKDLKSEGI